MSAYADKIAMEVIEADALAGARGLVHPPLDWHKAVALARAVFSKPQPEAAECEACAAWNLICPRCGAPKGGECGWPTSCPTGQNRSTAAPDMAAPHKEK